MSSTAALDGNHGLQAELDDNNSIYVSDDTPSAMPEYRMRFIFDPNSIQMDDGDAFIIFNAANSSSTEVVRVELRILQGVYQLRVALLDDDGNWTNGSWINVTDAAHLIELKWSASTAANENDGSLTLWLDDVQRASLTGIDNDTLRIDDINLGVVSGVDVGTRGTLYFDAFISGRPLDPSDIGPSSSPGNRTGR